MSRRRASSDPRRSSAALRLVSMVLLCGWVSACATPVNYFAGAGPALPPLDERARDAVLAELEMILRDSPIQVVELLDGATRREVVVAEGDISGLASFPLEALAAAALGAPEELRGAEFDLLARSAEAGSGKLVTVQHDLDGRLRLWMGNPPIVPAGPAPTSADLTARFGIGPLLDGEGHWAPEERALLGLALGLLTPAELAYLRDLPYRRDVRTGLEGHAGYYTSSEKGFGGGLIVLLDIAFDADESRFTGSPDRSYPRSVSVILHEIGHAIAKLDREQILFALERDTKKYNELVEVFNQYVDAINERNRVMSRLRYRDARRVGKELQILEEQHRKLERILRTASRKLGEMVEIVRGPSPMEQAYAQLENARRGPTPYGRTSVIEGFAEAFALYHLDPESVRRFSPAVHDWFARDGHLLAARFPPLEDFAGPAAAGAEQTPPPVGR